jgi:hypothetical protein
MPETEERLQYLAKDLKPGDHVFRSRRIRGGSTLPLGEKGMANLVKRQFARAGIQGTTGHDLRRTFASLVRRAGADEFLTMRLLRDIIPGSGKRYFGVSAHELSAELRKYSPLSLVKGMPAAATTAEANVLPVQGGSQGRPQAASAEAGTGEMVEAGERACLKMLRRTIWIGRIIRYNWRQLVMGVPRCHYVLSIVNRRGSFRRP